MDASIPWSDLDEDGLAPGEEFEASHHTMTVPIQLTVFLGGGG